jgi:hypothetical protein
VSFHHQAKLRI